MFPCLPAFFQAACFVLSRTPTLSLLALSAVSQEQWEICEERGRIPFQLGIFPKGACHKGAENEGIIFRCCSSFIIIYLFSPSRLPRGQMNVKGIFSLGHSGKSRARASAATGPVLCSQAPCQSHGQFLGRDFIPAASSQLISAASGIRGWGVWVQNFGTPPLEIAQQTLVWRGKCPRVSQGAAPAALQTFPSMALGFSGCFWGVLCCPWAQGVFPLGVSPARGGGELPLSFPLSLRKQE